VQRQLATLMDQRSAHATQEKGHNLRGICRGFRRNFNPIATGHKIAGNARNNPQERTWARLRMRAHLTSPGKPRWKPGNLHD